MSRPPPRAGSSFRIFWDKFGPEVGAIKLGLFLGYIGAEHRTIWDLVKLAESSGYHSVWVAEAWGADAVTPLAYLAAKTNRILLGAGVMQLAGRTPAMCAMQAQTVDALAGGNRFIAGLGVSGPQIVEGWHGQPWGRPYYRMRDYIQIMRKIFARDEPVAHKGKELALPYTGPGATGLGKPLRSMMYPNKDLPIWIGAGGDSMIRLAGEMAQGVIPMHYIPSRFPQIARLLQEGFDRAKDGRGWSGFELFARVVVRLNKDVRAALDEIKQELALFVGGMGAKEMNFHKAMMIDSGWPDEAERIQQLFLEGRREEAAAAVPDDYADAYAIVGPPDRIRERYREWAASGLTGMCVQTTDPSVIELMTELAADVPAIGPQAALANLQ